LAQTGEYEMELLKSVEYHAINKIQGEYTSKMSKMPSKSHF